VLIIGGGDFVIAKKLLQRLDCHIGTITICELDERVSKVVEKYFQEKNDLVKEAIKDGKLKLIFKDGAEFAKERAQQI